MALFRGAGIGQAPGGVPDAGSGVRNAQRRLHGSDAGARNRTDTHAGARSVGEVCTQFPQSVAQPFVGGGNRGPATIMESVPSKCRQPG